MSAIEDKVKAMGLFLPEPFKFPKPNRTGCVVVGSIVFASGHGRNIRTVSDAALRLACLGFFGEVCGAGAEGRGCPRLRSHHLFVGLRSPSPNPEKNPSSFRGPRCPPRTGRRSMHLVWATWMRMSSMQ